MAELRHPVLTDWRSSLIYFLPLDSYNVEQVQHTGKGGRNVNITQRTLPYIRQYVIVAIYEVLEQDRIRYEKTDSSTIVSEISVYGNKSVFSISVSEQADGTQLLVTMVRPHKYLSADGIQRAVTAVADRISQYLENETVLANASLRRSKLQESVCKA